MLAFAAGVVGRAHGACEEFGVAEREKFDGARGDAGFDGKAGDGLANRDEGMPVTAGDLGAGEEGHCGGRLRCVNETAQGFFVFLYKTVCQDARMLTPLLCGRFDGTHLWVQWSPVPMASGYMLEVRWRRPGAEWGPWRRTGGNKMARTWLVVPMWKLGAEVQARVSLADAEEWELAREVDFRKARARFEISSERRVMMIAAGTTLAAQVDGHACGYVVPRDVEAGPGAPVEVECEASMSTGFCQLDRPEHFDIRPMLGVRIRNLEPSRNDVAETGRDFTELLPREPDGPILLVRTGSVVL